MGHILSGVDTIVLVYMAAARDSWNSSKLLCTSRAQVLATKNVSNYAFITYATARRPVGEGKPAAGAGSKGAGGGGGGESSIHYTAEHSGRTRKGQSYI
jgi:hypothetical protein